MEQFCLQIFLHFESPIRHLRVCFLHFSDKPTEDAEWEDLEQVFDEGSIPSPISDIQDVSSGGDSDSDWEPVDSPKKVTEALAAEKKSEKKLYTNRVLNEEAHFIRSTKGCAQLKDPEGHIYTRNQVKGDTQYFNCIKRQFGCKALAQTKGFTLTRLRGPHVHVETNKVDQRTTKAWRKAKLDKQAAYLAKKSSRPYGIQFHKTDDIQILDNVEANFGHFHAKKTSGISYQLKDPQGNIYTRNKIKGDLIYWVCVKRNSHQCKAKAITKGKMLEKLIGIHADHTPKVHGNTGHIQYVKKVGKARAKARQKQTQDAPDDSDVE